MQTIERQLKQFQQGALAVLIGIIKVLIEKTRKIPFYILAVPAVLIIRLIKPWLLVRIEVMNSLRIGHFVGNTEMYLCERAAGINVPNQRYIDIFYMDGSICNQQLAIMWKRLLRIWPDWLLAPINRINRLIPGGKSHVIGQNTQTALDVHNLLDRFPPHLQFTIEEEVHGEVGLREMGIPIGMPFVCLNVRDSAYLSGPSWAYHNYRDSDIKNYLLAAEALAERGYFVIRMGAKVHASINSTHPKVIDYATNGMRSDFMDIFLGAKCAFCISTGTGWDGVPEMFRRPIVYVNMLPLGCLHTFRAEFLSITKRHVWRTTQKTLSLREIFSCGVGFCGRTSEYESKGVDLIENTSKEISDVVTEMEERLAGTWRAQPEDEALQRRFWEIFPTDAVDACEGKPLHGNIRSRFGAAYLRNYSDWLQ